MSYKFFYVKHNDKLIKLNNSYVRYWGTEPYELSLTDLKTLSLDNDEQTLGSKVESWIYPVWCIKFGAENNSLGAGVYQLIMDEIYDQSKMVFFGRWHKNVTAARNRAPLTTWGSNKTLVDSKNVTTATIDTYTRYLTSSNSYSSGVWADYKIIIDTKNNKCGVYVGDSYIIWTQTDLSATTFNKITCNGDSSSYKSALRNLYVYQCMDWATAESL